MSEFIGYCSNCNGEVYEEAGIAYCTRCKTNWNANEKDKLKGGVQKE